MDLREKDWINGHFPELCKPRGINDHKGTFGTLGVVGGASGMTGAPILSGKAGLKIGAGKVLVGFAQERLPLSVIPDAPELMLYTANRLLLKPEWMNAWVFGCGLGEYSLANTLLDKLLRLKKVPIVLDGDALSQLARRKWRAESDQVIILTPHPKEAGILAGCSTEEVQQRRAEIALTIAQKYQTMVVLKGHETLVSTPKTILWKNPTGNPGLATAGTGDVLAGFIGGLLAQGLPLFEAVCGAVWIHGRAADRLVSRGIGPVGLVASDLFDEARWIRNQVIQY